VQLLAAGVIGAIIGGAAVGTLGALTGDDRHGGFAKYRGHGGPFMRGDGPYQQFGGNGPRQGGRGWQAPPPGWFGPGPGKVPAPDQGGLPASPVPVQPTPASPEPASPVPSVTAS
jgi:hypothetical protein